MADTSMGETSIGGASGAAGAGAMPVFRIGLVMAGAVSAGAYTAGVVDFLLEALDAIEDVRAGRDTSHLAAGLPGEKPIVAPPYEARIAAMSGTSAGAMVTAIAATMLNTRIRPVTGETEPGAATGNPLYDCWVAQIHIDKLLATDDIKASRPLMSLLNAEPLDDITRAALAYARKADRARAYVDDRLPIHICVSNLRGVAYSLRLEGTDADAGHQMSLHADHFGFELQGPGVPEGTAPEEEDHAVLRAGGGDDTPWTLFGRVAVTSGAFPFGLAARALDRKFDAYVKRRWFIPSAAGPPERIEVEGAPAEPADDPKSWRSVAGTYDTIDPLHDTGHFADGEYPIVCVDGGMFNNEPLELCRRSLAKGGRNPRAPDEANAGVILIDPFPDIVVEPRSYNPNQARTLISVAKTFFSVLLAQSRFKADELALARNANVSSRFAILPSRRHPQTDAPQRPALASTGLAGFGGFLSREFRHHDYMLGRRNCQRFLATRFVLPADRAAGHVNPIVAPWLKDPRHAEFLVDSPFQMEGRTVKCLPVIPLLGKLASGDYTKMPAWPSRPSDLDLARLEAAIGARADAVASKLIDHFKGGWMARTAWKAGPSGWLRRTIVAAIVDDLKDNGIRPRER